jgi:Carbonic anhydrase
VLAQLPTEEERVDRMCELNVIQQVANVGHTSIVQNAWHRGQSLSIHGCIYGIKDGRWKSLNTTISGFRAIAAAVSPASVGRSLRPFAFAPTGHESLALGVQTLCAAGDPAPAVQFAALAGELSEQGVLGTGVVQGQRGAGGDGLYGPEFQVSGVEKHIRVAGVSQQAAEPAVIQVDAGGQLQRTWASLVHGVTGHSGNAHAAVKIHASPDAAVALNLKVLGRGIALFNTQCLERVQTITHSGFSLVHGLSFHNSPWLGCIDLRVVADYQSCSGWARLKTR